MRRVSRNFDGFDEAVFLSNKLEYDKSYSTMNINLFDLVTESNLALQELDYKFYNELEVNENRFKVILSKPRTKKVFKATLYAIIVLLMTILISYFSEKNLEPIIKYFQPSMGEYDVKLTIIVMSYILKQVQLYSQLILVFLVILLVLSAFIIKPFMSTKDGYYTCLILDDVGFYKIVLDYSNFHDNNLDNLYFVRFAESVLSMNLINHVKSVSYYSSYSRSMKDKKYYILDLPNDSISFNNEYDLEFYVKDFSKKDYRKLVEYLDSTEDSGER